MSKRLERLWNGEECESGIEFSLKEDGAGVILSAVFPAEVVGHPKAQAGEYREELWKWDVVEVFLSGEGRYVELNVAPNGAWWLQGFSAVRVVDEGFCVRGISVESKGERSPRVSLEIQMLEEYLGSRSGWSVNVTGILNSPEYYFLSWNALGGDEPDFHRPMDFSSYLDFISS